VKCAETMFLKREKMNRLVNRSKIEHVLRQKKDILVAVRMPKGLITELKSLQKTNHFMDMSDEIRFVIRKYTINASSNDPGELQKKEQLIADLSKIIDGLKNNAK
jgi:hypothetical protein